MDAKDLIARSGGFDWDDGNLPKVWARHHVTREECEQVFEGKPLYALQNGAHSTSAEERFSAFGKTTAGRRLCIIFTIRRNLIRVISARDMNRRERRAFPI